MTGWYSGTLWSGGWSGDWNSQVSRLLPGPSGVKKDFFIYLQEGQEVPVVVGAGGTPVTKSNGRRASPGGSTSFGGIVASTEETAEDMSARDYIFSGVTSILIDASKTLGMFSGGAGRGACWADPGSSMQNVSQEVRDGYMHAKWHLGAGGSVYAYKDLYAVGNGAPGSVWLRWHDPAKATGPLPTPALLSARRMASRAAAAPVTVNLYDPETGQGSVWREEDAEAKLAEGLITEEAWREICAQKAAEEYAAWLVDPDTRAERFEMLRMARDAKLAEHDVQVVQLQRQARAGADVAGDLAAWDAYAVALCDLPAQDGAPWDGGGALTPWPEEPAVTKVQEA